ncbi:MAG TPA: hypothetical protein VEG37_02845, partial [Burkholderiales bacterium]|nr:hypothetical protein [Burkholderiales bacterium]
MEQNKAIAALQSIILALCMVVASYSFAATEESNKEPGSLPAAEKPDQGPSPAAPAEEQPSPAAPAEESGKEPGSAGAMEETEKKPPRDLVLKGDAKCTRCHNENEEYPVLMIGRTEHGTVADKRTPTC